MSETKVPVLWPSTLLSGLLATPLDFRRCISKCLAVSVCHFPSAVGVPPSRIFLCALFLVLPEEILKQFLALLAGQRRLPQCRIASQVPGFALEGDLCDPFLAAVVFVDAPHPTGVGPENGFAADRLDAGPVYEVLGIVGGVETAAARGMADLETGLAYNRFIPTTALTSPVVLSVPFSIVGFYRQLAELFADPVLEGRAAETSAALAVAAFQLSCRCQDPAAAVTRTFPQVIPACVLLFCLFDDRKFAEPSTGQIIVAGRLRHTAAGHAPSVL